MGLRQFGKVWEAAPLKGEPLCVLLALAELADEAGQVTISHAHIARRGRVSFDGARMIIRTLVRDGYVVRIRRGNGLGISSYRVLFGLPGGAGAAADDAPEGVRGGVMPSQGGV